MSSTLLKPGRSRLLATPRLLGSLGSSVGADPFVPVWNQDITLLRRLLVAAVGQHAVGSYYLTRRAFRTSSQEAPRTSQRVVIVGPLGERSPPTSHRFIVETAQLAAAATSATVRPAAKRNHRRSGPVSGGRSRSRGLTPRRSARAHRSSGLRGRASPRSQREIRTPPERPRCRARSFWLRPTRSRATRRRVVSSAGASCMAGTTLGHRRRLASLGGCGVDSARRASLLAAQGRPPTNFPGGRLGMLTSEDGCAAGGS